MPNQVTGFVIEDAQVETKHLKAGSVTAQKLASSSVSEAKLKDDSVPSNAIASSAVTSTKFVSGAVTGDHIPDAAITFVKLSEALFPEDGIIMWVGETIPTGWVLCDGTNDTPDLRNRFLTFATNSGPGGLDNRTVVEGGTHTHTGTTSDAGSHDHGGSTTAVTLNSTEIPSHRHHLLNSGTGTTVGNTVSLSRFNNAGGAHESYYLSGTYNEAGLGRTSGVVDPTTKAVITSGQSHSHTVSTAGLHSHPLTLTNSTTHEHTVDVRPAFIAVKFIKKT
jgi:hypothetical protein